jgi:C1A family cysteine protease
MKKFAFILITAILLAAPSLCGASDFRPLEPGMAARIETLRQAVQAEGGTYEVGYSTAMEKPVEHLTGLKVPPGLNKTDAPSVPMLGATAQTLPSSYDWRALNGVTPIKDQGNCGSCWAFSTVGPLESQILLQGGGTVSLSEQYLVSCNVDRWSCNGGWFAHNYHMNESGQDNNGPGAVLTSEDPYTATSAPCSKTYDHPYRISNWAYIGSESAVPSVQAIKQAIHDYGPISAGIYVGPKFQAYRSGVFNTNESGTINHAIVLVGWQDQPGTTTGGYWILRNSWGTTWGQNGYMYIGYGISQVGYGANFIEYAGGPPPPPPPPTPTSEPNLTGVFENLYAGNGGRTVSGNLWVENIGTAATASSFRVLLYVSNDGSSLTSLLGSATISTSISPDYYINLRFNESSSTSFSGKYLIAVIDPDNIIPEPTPHNNTVVSNMIPQQQRWYRW